jgi:hypothetical protein
MNLDELARYGPVMVVSKAHRCIVTSACTEPTVNVVELAKVVLSYHDFSLYKSQLARLPDIRSNDDGASVSTSNGVLICSKSIEHDLALCIVLMNPCDDLAPAIEAFSEAAERLRSQLKQTPWTGTVPPHGGGGHGAASEAGLAQYLPRRRNRSN